MENSVKIGDKYRPVKLMADQPEPKQFTVLDIFPKLEMALIQSEDGNVKKVQFWFINNYCKKDGA